jgi:hypothetical protein
MVLLRVTLGEPNINGLILSIKNQPFFHHLLLSTKQFGKPLKCNMNSAAFVLPMIAASRVMAGN